MSSIKNKETLDSVRTDTQGNDVILQVGYTVGAGKSLEKAIVNLTENNDNYTIEKGKDIVFTEEDSISLGLDSTIEKAFVRFISDKTNESIEDVINHLYEPITRHNVMGDEHQIEYNRSWYYGDTKSEALQRIVL